MKIIFRFLSIVVVTLFAQSAVADVLIERDEQHLVRIFSDYYPKEFTDIRIWTDPSKSGQIRGFRIKDYSTHALASAQIVSPFRSQEYSLASVQDKYAVLRQESFLGLKIPIVKFSLNSGFNETEGGNTSVQLMAHAPSNFFELPLQIKKSAHGLWHALYQIGAVPFEITQATIQTRYNSWGIPHGMKTVTLRTETQRSHEISIP